MFSETVVNTSKSMSISCQSLSKCYEVYSSPQDRIKQALWPSRKRYFQEFWAVRDISFEISRGETVGIVGRNGSGKSTLLQLICGTLVPTNGQALTQGRISALLELGSGFSPEFTGRENIYLNAAILGLSKDEVEAELDNILAFADIGGFIDQPVKTYSSGMVVRLAFSVAINIRPDILIVDEALSVGDERFQRKCFSRIDTIRDSGASVLFVSHSADVVAQLCGRALLIDSGRLLADGSPKQVIGCYQKLLYTPNQSKPEVLREIKELISTEMTSEVDILQSQSKTNEATDVQMGCTTKSSAGDYDPNLKPVSSVSYAENGAAITHPAIYTLDDQVVNILRRGDTYLYRYKVHISQHAEFLRFGMLIKTTSGVELGGHMSSAQSEPTIQRAEPGDVYTVTTSFCCRLNPGVYFLNAGVVGVIDGESTYLHRILDAAMFRVSAETDMLSTGIVDFSGETLVNYE